MFCISALVRMHVYMCAHKETGCKGTKKIPYTQIYMGKSFIFVNFASKKRSFESKEVVDWENYRDDNAARRL